MRINPHERTRLVHAGAFALACASAPTAMAEGTTEGARPCGVGVVERGALPDAWRTAATTLREDLAKLAHDECVEGTLFIEIGEGGAASIVLRIRLDDGREAIRIVTRPSALSAIAFGLVVAVPAATLPVVSVNAPVVPEGAVPQPPPHVIPTPPTAAKHETHLGLNVGLGAGVRAAFPTNVVVPDFDVRADVRADDWLVVADVRYAPVGALFSSSVGGYAYSEIALALGGGRRFHLGRASLELTAMAALVLMTEDADAPVEEGGSPSELRLEACARVLFPWGTRVKPTLTVDGELAPTAVATPVRVGADLPPLPTWSLGVRVGVVGELL